VFAAHPHGAPLSRAPRPRSGPAKRANENPNSPDETDVQAAVANIEQNYVDLAKERGIYMNKCKKIRATMAGDYDTAAQKGIAKKLLKMIIKERELERKIYAVADSLENDERSEMDMLKEKLGEFANTPLGKAALAQTAGGNGQAQAGAT